MRSGAVEQQPVAERHAQLRARYAEHPEQAVSSKWARTSNSRIDPGDPSHGEVEVGRGYGVSLAYGLDRLVGGEGDLPNPGDLLCAALAACTDGTIRMIAALLEVELEELRVTVAGDLDVRGTLAIDSGVPVGFRQLACEVDLRPVPGSDARSVRRLLAAAERLCVNADTLRERCAIEVRLAREAEPAI